MICYDAAGRLDLIAGERKTFTIDWDDYLTPGQTISSIASIGIDEAGGPTVVASSVRPDRRSIRVQIDAEDAGEFSLTMLAAVTERGQTNVTPAVRVLVRVSEPELQAPPVEMRLGDTKRFTIPFDNQIEPGEKIVGILSLVMNRAGGGTISGVAYSNDGKKVGFVISGPTVRENYLIAAWVSVQNLEGTLDRLIAVVGLHVC